MEKKIATLALFAILLLSMTVLKTTTRAATDEEIEASGAAAVAYLASVQNPDGSWGSGGNPTAAKTGLVLLKFSARAYELNKDPFDDDPLSPTYYVYANNVIAGFNYLFGHAQVVDITPQTHGDPDTNVNGKGIVFGTGYDVYNTGICLTALAFSNHPNDRSAVIGALGLRTYKQIAQDTVDWLCFAQGDLGNDRGGYGYTALDSASGWTDNSNTGYAYLGLAFAKDPPFSCTVPQWVMDELNIWIGTIQDPVNGDSDDGGSYYNPDWLPGTPWCNVLKTGNLIFEMAFYGDSPSTPRVQDAVDYLERHWRDTNNDPGWGYSLSVADYQAKFLVEKGLTYMGIAELDTDGDGVDEDWFNQEPPAIPAQDFASVIVQQQLPSGGWPNSPHDDGDGILSTAWAVLTLERFAPTPLLSVSISPTTAKIKIGESVTFTSSVSGGMPPYSYQWYLNGAAVSGAIFPTWTFTPVSTGTYTVYLNVTDSVLKTAKSNVASVTVAPPLTVSISPTSASILVGQSVTFTSTVSGGYPPYSSYQWYLDVAPVSGATSSSWTFTPTTPGIYYVYLQVTDANNNVAQSETARITVSTVPVGGYSISLTKQTPPSPVAAYIALIALFGAILSLTKRKRK